MTDFDIHRLPLRGVHLIDASAGTGKTYTITGLVLRLLLERQLAMREILVVTYTEAATDDLRGRIRERIRQALDALEAGGSADPFLARLVAGAADQAAARLRLQGALRDFDEAAIFTIHGFCQRVLRENALETGALLEAELAAEEEPLLRESVDDLWRQEVYHGPPLLVAHLAGRLDPDRLRSLLRQYLHDPALRIIPRPAPDRAQLAAAGDRFQGALTAVQAAWPAARSAVAEIFTRHPALNRQRYRLASLPRWLEAMDGLCASPALFDGFERFTASGLAAGVKNGFKAPEHPFFELCENLHRSALELLAALNREELAFLAGLFARVPQELRHRKQQRAVYSFDDLLLQVHGGLLGAGGARLAAGLRRRFPVALIDEFQDTDPVQYEIFAAIYRNQPDTLLFLIGDPKQAIYSFRGADIFAYFQACREAESRSTLGVNYRSAPGLVRAVNVLFTRPRDPFLFSQIDFEAVEPARVSSPAALHLEGMAPEPMQLWLVTRRPEEAAGPLPASTARERIRNATAAEIVRLLQLGREGRARLDGRPVTAGDIAILVRTNREALLMHEALAGCGVPAVLHSVENLFATREAAELARLLAAVAAPADESKIRVALVTGICGLDGERLARLTEDEVAWEKWLLKFRHYHELWRDHGLIRMLRQLLLEEGVRARLLGRPDGERRLTNLLHLTEVLHRAAVAERLGMTGLVKFLTDRLAADDEPVEEYLLRLESDDRRVRIVTIHKAKGLEYPIVFCPFCWQAVKRDQPPLLFHHPHEEGRRTLDLGSEAKAYHLQLARREELAENLRLLYVALTRARERCYLVWGPFRGAETSALAYLLHQPPEEAAADRLAATAARVLAMSDQQLLMELTELASGSGGAVGLRSLDDELPNSWHPERAAAQDLASRAFSGRINSNWRVTSYSGLVHSSRHERRERPDREGVGASGTAPGESRPAPAGSGRPLSSFDFPAGAGPGIFLHQLLEQLDFTAAEPERARLVTERLAAHGLDEYWTEPLLTMLAQVLATPLAPEWPGLRLSAIASDQRLDELEFYFPLAFVPAALGAALTAGGSPWAARTGGRVAQLSWPELRGFCRGFIDLVFAWQGRYFIVDWKSNFLGASLDDYHRSRLDEVMVRELYVLQYHLYTVALHRYLASRVAGYRYESHFGGVFYLFLRGLDRGRGSECGVFSDRPAAETVDGLDRLLSGGRSW